MRCIVAAGAVLFGAIGAHAEPAKPMIVVVSPGSPGTTEEAQPRMDAFASAVTAGSGVSLTAVYDPSDEGGVARIGRAGIAIVSLPFFLAHEKELGLHPRLQMVQKGRPALERWSLVAQKGRITGPDSLAGFTIISNAAFAPAFVRGAVLGGFGALPGTAKLVQSRSVLSSLRRAADGEPVAVLLDGTQEASLASLPFASKLEVVTRSPALPAGLVVTVDKRIPQKEWRAIEAALLALSPAGLDALQLERLTPVDEKALGIARKAAAP